MLLYVPPDLVPYQRALGAAEARGYEDRIRIVMAIGKGLGSCDHQLQLGRCGIEAELVHRALDIVEGHVRIYHLPADRIGGMVYLGLDPGVFRPAGQLSYLDGHFNPSRKAFILVTMTLASSSVLG